MSEDIVSDPRPAWTRQSGDCCVPGCDRVKAKSGYCGAHYQRLRKKGDPGPAFIRAKQPVFGEGQCLIDDCESPSRKRGWCMKHYDRWRVHGTPSPEPVFHGHKRFHVSSGYMLVQFNGSTHFEHRVAWEAKYGLLLAGQNIHHKNGNRADNSYENLEIWDTRQPSGQRVEDKVEYAIQILLCYAPNLLSQVP